MASLRQRLRGRAPNEEDTQGVNEPLLQSDHEESSGPRDDLYNDVNSGPLALLQALLQGWDLCTHTMVYYVSWLLGLAVLPSEDQLGKLVRLRLAVEKKFDESDPEHQVELAGLWKICFPSEPWFCGPSDRWKDAGFQNSNPASDFRGGGIYSLRNLIYMGQNHNTVFKSLLWKEAGQRSDFEYPFSAAGINLTFRLEELLELRSRRQSQVDVAPSSKVGLHFIQMLDSNANAFEEIYVATFQVLDSIWLDRKASYMDFPGVLDEALLKVKRAMVQLPKSVPELRDRLGLDA